MVNSVKSFLVSKVWTKSEAFSWLTSIATSVISNVAIEGFRPNGVDDWSFACMGLILLNSTCLNTLPIVVATVKPWWLSTCITSCGFTLLGMDVRVPFLQ